MKWTFLKDRYFLLGLLFFFLFGALGFRLAVLQVQRGAEYRLLSENLITRVIPLKAPRGIIYDRNGEVLATNRPSFNVNIFQNELPEGDANGTILRSVRIIEKNGDQILDRLPLTINFDDKGEAHLTFDWGDIEGEKLEREKNRWLKLYGFDSDITAEEAYMKLRDRYGIGGEFTHEEALKILAVWNEIRAAGLRAYQPVIFARDVKLSTVAVLSEYQPDITGIEAVPSYIRYYPNGSLASHVLGYMGVITAEEWEVNKDYYLEKGYDPSVDLVGRWELERTLEPYLHGKDGGQRVQVDVAGRNIRVLESIDPVAGHDVYLTLDIKLQRAAETALTETMELLRAGGFGDPRPNARVGAVVVLDVKTGGVLALVSKPDFDPNFSAAGHVDPEIWRELNPKYPNPRDPEREDLDPTLPRPLHNNAVRGIYPPGSIFKMLVAIAALQEGVIEPDTIIVDEGRYTRYSTVNAPACWIWNQSRMNHGPEDVIAGLRDSCNYYFYEAGDRLGIEIIEDYAARFGLGRPTGIELPGEAAGIVAGKAHTNSYLAQIVKYRIAELAGKTWSEASEEEKAAYGEAAAAFVANNSLSYIESELKKLGINASRSDIDNRLYSYIRDYGWNPGKTLSASIGQAENTFSPLQMANYIATLVNGGTRYKVHAVGRIVSPDGEVVLENLPEPVEHIAMDQENYEAVMMGMRAVVSSDYENVPGTAARYFQGFNIRIGGKTGSAQFPGRDSYGWFVGFAPYEDPKIAVAVMIGQAGSGGYTAPVARAVFQEYFRSRQNEEVLYGRNQLLR